MIYFVIHNLYFNSIKVRLELLVKMIILFLFSRFQFHKGTIRTLLFIYCIFQFILFQFHKGTIRTIYALGLVAALLFQFHKGTIRTFVEDKISKSFQYFNSIKVRLERLRLTLVHLSLVDFNSIKVRLELRTQFN